MFQSPDPPQARAAMRLLPFLDKFSALNLKLNNFFQVYYEAQIKHGIVLLVYD